MKVKIYFMLLSLVGINMNIICQEPRCDPKLLDKAISQLDAQTDYIQDFQIYLPERTGSKIPEARYSMVLTDSTIYHFSIVSSDEYPGKAVFRLFDDKLLLGSTYDPEKGKLYSEFTFICRKSAIYHMFINFIDGKEGCAVGILGYKGKL